MQEPTIGRIVIYRNSRGVDMPAIITALTDDPEYVHLHLFVPPGQQPDTLSYQHGTPRADADEPDVLLTACWRWPDRKPPVVVEIGPTAADVEQVEAATAKASARAGRAKPGESDDQGA